MRELTRARDLVLCAKMLASRDDDEDRDSPLLTAGSPTSTPSKADAAAPPIAPAVLSSAGFNILNGTLGPGMLVLPLALWRTGAPLGFGMLVLDWAASYASLRLLIDACHRSRASSLVTLSRACSRRLALLTDWSVVLYFYGTCVSYLILIGGTFERLLVGCCSPAEGGAPVVWWLGDFTPGSQALLAAFTLCVMLPLSCSKSLDSLSAFSSLIVLLYGVLAAVVWTSTARPPPAAPGAGAAAAAAAAVAPAAAGAGAAAAQAAAAAAAGVLPTGGAWRVLQAVPSFTYCFSSQAVYPAALAALLEPPKGAAAPPPAQTYAATRQVVDATYGFTLLVYGLVGLGGALRVHGAPAANVLDSYEPGAALLAARLALAFALSLSFPVMFLVARTHVYSLAGRRLADQDHDASRKRVSAAMVVLALVLALYFPEIDALLGLLGATCSVSLSFVVPPLLYRRHVVELEAHPRVRRERVLVGVLMTFGAAVAAASVPVTMWELVATVRAR